MRKRINIYYTKIYNYLRDTVNTPTDRIAQRRARMIAQGIAGAAITALGIFFAWRELGSGIFSETIFWILLSAWAYLGATAFILRLEEAENKTTDEKIDELSNDIKELVKELKKERENRTKGGEKQ